MLQRTARFGMILKMLPARRAYPAPAGQPTAAALRGFRLSRFGNPLYHARPPRRSPAPAGTVK